MILNRHESALVANGDLIGATKALRRRTGGDLRKCHEVVMAATRASEVHAFETRIRADEREKIVADLEAQAEWCAKQAEVLSAKFDGRWPSDQECLVLARHIASRDGYRKAADRVRAGS